VPLTAEHSSQTYHEPTATPHPTLCTRQNAKAWALGAFHTTDQLNVLLAEPMLSGTLDEVATLRRHGAHMRFKLDRMQVRAPMGGGVQGEGRPANSGQGVVWRAVLALALRYARVGRGAGRVLLVGQHSNAAKCDQVLLAAVRQVLGIKRSSSRAGPVVRISAVLVEHADLHNDSDGKPVTTCRRTYDAEYTVVQVGLGGVSTHAVSHASTRSAPRYASCRERELLHRVGGGLHLGELAWGSGTSWPDPRAWHRSLGQEFYCQG
jgi:hypothetical protein